MFTVAAGLCRLTQHVGVEQPAHSLCLLGNSRLRGGRSSMGTGHCFQTVSQFGFCFSLRSLTTSSSASKLASNWSPGAAGARATGMLTRRLVSSVTIIVGLSHKSAACQGVVLVQKDRWRHGPKAVHVKIKVPLIAGDSWRSSYANHNLLSPRHSPDAKGAVPYKPYYLLSARCFKVARGGNAM